MTPDIALVLVVLLVAVVLFAAAPLPADLVALLVMVVLLLLGLVSPEQAVAGFSNPATITVAAMFVLSAGLYRSGAVNFVGMAMTKVGRRSLPLAVLSLMLSVAVVSAFANNTAAVAVLLPIAISAAAALKVAPARLLMPLSFAAMFGGSATLIGTSTNLLVSAEAERLGLAPITMFEMSALGVILTVTGTLYMLLVGGRLLPARPRASALDEEYGMHDYLVEVVVGDSARSVGQAIGDSALVRESNVAVLDLIRDGARVPFPSSQMRIEAGDVIRCKADVKGIRALQEREGISIRPRERWAVRHLPDGPTQQVEVVLAPSSPLRGRTLQEARFATRFGAMVLALRHRGRLMHEELERTRLESGDALLVEVPTDQVERIRRSADFVVVNLLEVPTFRRRLIIPAVGILVGVVTLAALGLVPILVGSIVGALLMVVAGVLSLEEAYEAIDWRVIFLLAGILALGAAMTNSGAATWLADVMVGSIGPLGPTALVAAFYLVTALLTSAMSNNATAVLLAPVAVATASALQVDPRPLLMAVAFAASASFATPMGYQTNLMIFGAGNFRFMDFVKVGGPLTLLFWVVATLLIPVIWPF